MPPSQRGLGRTIFMKPIGLVEASLGSPWLEALDMADCRLLMHLLEENPCRVVQRSEGGFTVLHAAAMRGCLKLLDQVFELFQGDNLRFVDEREGIKLSLDELFKAKCFYNRRNEEGIGAVGLTAAEFAWWSMGDCDARLYLNDDARLYLNDRTRFDSRPFSSDESEIFGSSMDSEGADEENPSPRMLLLGVLADHRGFLTDIVRSFRFEEDLDYNFVADREELRFHHACQYVDRGEVKEYVEAVIMGCMEKGPRVLKYLFQLRNAQGQTPLHVAVECGTCLQLVRLIPGRESGYNAECLNMRDSRGWTALHCCASFEGLYFELLVLLKDGRADVNAEAKFMSGRSGNYSEATPLHLAVLHNSSMVMERLLEDPRTNVNAHFHRQLYFDDNLYVSRFGHPLKEWTTLQLAAVAGLPEMVKVLLRFPKVQYLAKRQKHDEEKIDSSNRQKIKTIHLAAASGDPETLRLFITNQQFDPLVTCYGATSLHFAVASRRPTFLQSFRDKPPYISKHILTMEDFYSMASYWEAKRKGAKIASYEGREACISILVHAGVDLWQKDDGGNFPEPGSSASSANHLSWQKLFASETLEAKKSLNEAGNAISVVAALVATASYVGPLQPPLGYANDFVQTSSLSIRIFMVSNSVSFYLAIASIMFAVVPSLPMPQEGIYEEWRRTRKTIGFAISLLLMSVLGVLISFAAASNAVLSEEYSWRHGGLTFYPAVVAGLVCLIGILWFFIRLLRLIFPKNVVIRHLYQSLFRIKEERK